ncbi:hypothetical protein LMIY3S_03728 [Labrys miyagiensis]
MILINRSLMLDYAGLAAQAAGPDIQLDRNVCLAFNYLRGRIFAAPLAVLSNGSLASPDGAKLGYPDPLTSSVDAVEQLRIALFPSSLLTLSLVATSGRHYECMLNAHSPSGRAIFEVVESATEPCARLAAILKVAAASDTVPVLDQ